MLEALNRLPKAQHGVDIMRVRRHLLAGQGQLYRQTLLTSSFPAPQLNAVFGRLCCSHAGKLRLVPQPAGVLAQVVPQVRAAAHATGLCCCAALAGLRGAAAHRRARSVHARIRPARPRALQVRQVFERFDAPSAAAAADARFAAFTASLWPRLADAAGGGLLLFVPSYFDFVRLR